MPKVLLTHEQKLADRNRKIRSFIADNLSAVKNRTRMSFEEMGHKAGLGRVTISKILAGEDATIPLSSVIMLLDMAGLTIKKRVDDATQE